MQLFTIAAMLFAAFGVTFALQNSIPVSVSFLFWHFDSSLALVLLLTLAIGGFIVGLVSTPSTLRKQWVIKRQNKRIAELEKTCGSLEESVSALQSRLPAEVPVVVEELPYVGLKKILVGESRSGV